MMCCIAVTIVLSIRLVGIMLLMSLLTLPQITVNLFTSDFKKIIFGSIAIGFLGCVRARPFLSSECAFRGVYYSCPSPFLFDSESNKSGFKALKGEMKKGFYYIIALLIVSLFWSCSTKKNTKASRFYHAFNSRYNIYFNGKTSFDEALLSMQNGYKESYSDMILMYPISAQPKDKPETGGPFDRAIEKSNKAIKLHSIKAKPPKKPGWRNDPKQRAWQEQEEYNPFLKKCWLMMGQAQFYNADFLQASATFSYIARHYAHDEEVVAEARLWQARCYSEMEWFYEAEDILGKLNTNGIPRKNLNQYAAVYADYLVKNKQYEEAVPYFKTAIKAEKNRRQRTRMKYLLGQIYAEQDQNGLAYQMFRTGDQS